MGQDGTLGNDLNPSEFRAPRKNEEAPDGGTRGFFGPS